MSWKEGRKRAAKGYAAAGCVWTEDFSRQDGKQRDGLRNSLAVMW